MMRFLTADQKQRHVNVCEELRQTASDDATLSKVISGDESCIYVYDPETKQQSLEIEEQSQEHAHIFLRHQGDCS
jgi:hypothetical protein